jgi:ankyrin repeat protein
MTPLNPQTTSDPYNPHHQSTAAVPIDQPAQERCDENASQKQQSPQMRQKASSASNNPLWLGGGHALGAWTQLHLEASIDPKKIPALIASGAPIDAQTDDGLTLLMYFIMKKDANAQALLLAAGANPLLVPKQAPSSPLVYALTQQPELAMALAEALPMGATGNFFEQGLSEVHFATTLPAVLYVMLSRGMRDSSTATGVTALVLSVEKGELQAVKYLLGQRPTGESDSEFKNYLNSEMTPGFNALTTACHLNRFEIAELLMRHGAILKHPHDEKAFFKLAYEEKNFDLLKFLLKNSSATSRPQLADLLQRSLRRSWTEGVAELAPVVNLSTTDQIKLLNIWKNHPKAELLTAIAPAIIDAACSSTVLLKHTKILDALVKHSDLDLMSAVLQFFERRKSFGFIIQSAISYMLDDTAPVFDDSQGKLLLQFVLQSRQLPGLVSDPETAMRLLQLSDRLKNYVLVTEIKGENYSP